MRKINVLWLVSHNIHRFYSSYQHVSIDKYLIKKQSELEIAQVDNFKQCITWESTSVEAKSIH